LEAAMQIDYTVNIWKEDNQYIAHALPIDVMSMGSTPEEARIAIREAVSLFIESAKEIGTLDDILEECGYILKKDKQISPSWISIERQSIAIGA
jgi:predicted RNase H-like HicB family nuclease